MTDAHLQATSRARIRAETKGDPSWVDLGDGYFALHIQYGGNAIIVHQARSGDADAFREWLAYHWPAVEGVGDTPESLRGAANRLEGAMG